MHSYAFRFLALAPRRRMNTDEHSVAPRLPFQRNVKLDRTHLSLGCLTSFIHVHLIVFKSNSFKG